MVVAALVAGTLACTSGVALAAGIADISRSVDWGFASVAFDLHRTGHLHLINWGPMTIIAHLLWAQPFLFAGNATLHVYELSAPAASPAGILAQDQKVGCAHG